VAEKCSLFLRSGDFERVEAALRDLIEAIDAGVEGLRRSLRLSEQSLMTTPQKLDINALLCEMGENLIPKRWPDFHVRLHDRIRGCETHVYADADTIREVICELVNNAVKVVSDGRGEMNVWTKSDEEYVHVFFQDSGPGLASDMKARVFEPRVTTDPKGTGLGLANCKTLLTTQGGTLVLVEDAGPPGVTFRMSLPSA
jgi:signal transduction histidine kinase